MVQLVHIKLTMLRSFLCKIDFSLGGVIVTWLATTFNVASEEGIFGLLALTPSFCLQPAALQWQSWSAPNWTNLLNMLDWSNHTKLQGSKCYLSCHVRSHASLLKARLNYLENLNSLRNKQKQMNLIVCVTLKVKGWLILIIICQMLALLNVSSCKNTNPCFTVNHPKERVS